jgi:DNA-binding ferritin-like protein
MQTNPHIQSSVSEGSIETLQECLRSELSATETYQLALSNVAHVGVHSVLQQILTSHATRTERLGERLRWMGAEVTKSSGVWGALAKIVQVGADILGDRAVVAALKEGEDHGLRLYMDAAPHCDASTRGLIEAYLLPEQRRTRELCWSLKEYVNAPS